MKTVHLAYGKQGMALDVPDGAALLEGPGAPALADPAGAVAQALTRPIDSAPLADLVRRKQPRSVAITISDITRPVPNGAILPPLLEVLNRCGVDDARVVIIVGTGLHRRPTPEEHAHLVGPEVLRRIEIVDHDARDPSTLVRVGDDPPVFMCRRFVEADLRIVTGLVEGHFMAGFSGGRKGVCPALVDLRTVQRFHGYRTLSDPRAETGVLDGNPCHDIALRVARGVGVDFLVNVAIARDRRPAGVYAGDLEAAHAAACRDVARWSAADVDGPFDLVLTSGGGFPLDQTFYQSVKGLCAALPALGPESTLLAVSHCGEGIGSPEYAELMLRYANRWRRFLADAAATDEVQLDQWQFQMQARLLERVGIERVWFATDGLPAEVVGRLSVTPAAGPGDARARAQRAVDGFPAARPGARVAVMPDGPYTMLRVRRQK